MHILHYYYLLLISFIKIDWIKTKKKNKNEIIIRFKCNANKYYSLQDSQNNADDLIMDKQFDGHLSDTDVEGNISKFENFEDIIANIESVNLSPSLHDDELICETFDKTEEDHKDINESFGLYKKRFQHTKQHTGLKNVSFNVGAAVTPTDKMEFNQEEPESFGVVKINRPIGKMPTSADDTDAMSMISSAPSEGLTDQGYVDLKFYHNKLW